MADSTSIPVNNDDDDDEIVMEKTVSGDGPQDCKKDKVQSRAEKDIESMEEKQSGRAGCRLQLGLQLRPWPWLYSHLIPQRTMTTTTLQTQEMDLSTTTMNNNEEYRRNTIADPMTTVPLCESNTRRHHRRCHNGRTTVVRRRRPMVNKKKWRRMIRTKRLQSIFNN